MSWKNSFRRIKIVGYKKNYAHHFLANTVKNCIFKNPLNENILKERMTYNSMEMRDCKKCNATKAVEAFNEIDQY